MSPLPSRDRKYLALVCLAACTLCAIAGWWSAKSWVWGGGLLPIMVYYINDRSWKIPFFPYDRVLSAHSNDGINWIRDSGMRLDVGGLHASVQVYAPVVVKMKQQWRMFYRAGGNNSSIASAVSDDGLLWREEAGWRLPAADGLSRLEPHCVLAVGGGWRLYYSVFKQGQWAIYRARSADGLAWEPESECSGLGDGNVKDAWVMPVGAETRIYYRCSEKGDMAFFTGVSVDGLDWRDIRRCSGYGAPEFPQVSCPRVLQQEGGGWRMYFSEWPDESFIGVRIVSASSADGVNWQRDEGVRLSPVGRYDPYGVFCPDIVADEQGWRMYYGGFWERHCLQPLTLFKRRGLRRQHGGN